MKTKLLAGVAAIGMLSGVAAGAQSLSFGLGLTTNYLSRGFTQTANGAAIQPWVEYESGGFYGGIWASNVSIGPDSIEVDLYGGYRWSINNTGIDVGYARYFYDSTGDAGGELYLRGTHDIGETGASMFVAAYFGHAGSITWNDFHAGLSVPLMDRLSGSARLGVNPGINTYGDLGVTYSVNDMIDVDLRVHSGNAEGTRFVLSSAFSF